MIPRLTSPAVCVIDDEQADYQPILDALLKLGIASIHVRGDTAAPLPPSPIKGLRIVFTDLYLSSSTGKTAAAHTAQVFKSVVSPDTAPVLTIIWSKHTDDRIADSDLPPDDQPTAAELFKNTLLEAEPKFRDRVIFTEMPKPKRGDRPEDETWIATLQRDIEAKITQFPACDLLWSWESLVREAGISISEELTTLALKLPATEDAPESPTLNNQLKIVLRQLAKEQGGPDCSAATAHKHLTAVLAQSLADEMEHSANLASLTHHGSWLSEVGQQPKDAPFVSQLNSLLLTAAVQSGSRSFAPGVVYKVVQPDKFREIFDEPIKELICACYNKMEVDAVWTKAEWIEKVAPIFLEISPACDVHQGTRRQTLLIGGVIGPWAGQKHARTSEAYLNLPKLFLRNANGEFGTQDVFMVFCSRYKMTLPHRREPEWLSAWFRLRELPTAALRNWHASHSARVGYVSLR